MNHERADSMTSLSDRFLHALRTLDAEALTQVLASDATRWLNVGNSTRNAAEIVAITRIERTLIRSSTVNVRQLTATADGFVLQFVFAGTTQSGADFDVPICIVARVVDGRISHYDEYTDEASLGPLQQELLASGISTSTIT